MHTAHRTQHNTQATSNIRIRGLLNKEDRISLCLSAHCTICNMHESERENDQEEEDKMKQN